jgi:Dyp-type peroxidase family
LPPRRRCWRSTGRGAEPSGLHATWINIAFSFEGLEKLVKNSGRSLNSQPFQAGLPARAGLLGDPSAPASEGYPDNWKVGAPGHVPDIFLLIASDRRDCLDDEATHVLHAARRCGLEVVYDETGTVRHDHPGHEHFGFADGISQPAIRGRASAAPGDHLIPRLIDPADPLARYMAKPGQFLIWPGEFVFGYPGQDSRDPLTPGDKATLGPTWTDNGTFLVFRRLRQDVALFWRFLHEEAVRLSAQPGFEGMTAERLGALLVGRWKSGAPVARTPKEDNPALAADPFANNNFNLGADSRVIPLASNVRYKGDSFAQARQDPIGLACPVSAHIRKVNPRDQSTEMGAAAETLTRRLLRRGLPFGPPLADPRAPDPHHGNRGLLWISYQTSIERQFEFLATSWMNATNRPRTPEGRDMIIGQNRTPGEKGIRGCTLFSGLAHSAKLETADQWIVPTGGGYFFAPSISALREVLGSE